MKLLGGNSIGHREKNIYMNIMCLILGRNSAVGISTRYGMDGPVIESLWGRDFPHPPRLTLGPTQPPIKWVPGLSRR